MLYLYQQIKKEVTKMIVNEFINLGEKVLVDIYDCKNHLVYSDFIDDQQSWLEQVEDEEIGRFKLNSGRIEIYLKDYEKTTYCVGDIWYASLAPTVGDEIGGCRMVRIEKVWTTRALVTVTPMIKIGEKPVQYFDEYEGTMTLSIERLQEKYESGE
jgi:hypothetical protein